MDHGFRFRVFMGLNNDRSFRHFSVQSFDVRPHIPPINIALRDNDPVAIGYPDHDALFVGVDGFRLVIFWLVHVKANFLYESCRHDEKDEHDEHNVQHRCEINLLFSFFVSTAAKNPSHVLPPYQLAGQCISAVPECLDPFARKPLIRPRNPVAPSRREFKLILDRPIKTLIVNEY